MNPNDETLLKAERRRMAAAFDDVLHEPVPDRLKALLAEPVPAAQVVDLAAVRARRPSMSRWAAWGGMAATLLLGTLVGTWLAPAGDAALSEGRWVAAGAIEAALNHQLASAPAGPVAVQISFKAKDGRYCRSFSTTASAGLACRAPDGTWALRQLVEVDTPARGGLRQAASALPPAVLAAVDATMAGAALNAEQERAARDAGWR